jgi:outer membrane protein OmpA-like peptidoglycan-associated protein
MEKLIHNSISITDGDLTELSARRAQTVREQLLEKGSIEPARIFVVKAPSLAPEKKEKVKDSRVDFKLK